MDAVNQDNKIIKTDFDNQGVYNKYKKQIEITLINGRVDYVDFDGELSEFISYASNCKFLPYTSNNECKSVNPEYIITARQVVRG